jgi:hypothetical protein
MLRLHWIRETNDEYARRNLLYDGKPVPEFIPLGSMTLKQQVSPGVFVIAPRVKYKIEKVEKNIKSTAFKEKRLQLFCNRLQPIATDLQPIATAHSKVSNLNETM